MMTLSRGFRDDAGTPQQTATYVAAAALIVTTVPTAIRAGTAAPASAARASTFPSRSGACGSASPLPMKHFNVREPQTGQPEPSLISRPGLSGRFSPPPGSGPG
jgi:hypothetical protein